MVDISPDWYPCVCEFCANAFVNSNLDHDNDLSYIPVGRSDRMHYAHIRSGDRRKTVIIVSEKGHDVWIYAPKYCPECGRKLFENDKLQR